MPSGGEQLVPTRRLAPCMPQYLGALRLLFGGVGFTGLIWGKCYFFYFFCLVPFSILGSFLAHMRCWLLSWKLKGSSVGLQHLPPPSVGLQHLPSPSVGLQHLPPHPHYGGLWHPAFWTQTVISLPGFSSLLPHPGNSHDVVSCALALGIAALCYLMFFQRVYLYSSFCRKSGKVHSCYSIFAGSGTLTRWLCLFLYTKSQ